MDRRTRIFIPLFHAALLMIFVAALTLSGVVTTSKTTALAAATGSVSQCPDRHKKGRFTITKQLDLEISCKNNGGASVAWPRLGAITSFDITKGSASNGIYSNNISVSGDNSAEGTAIGYAISQYCVETNLGVSFPNADPTKPPTQVSLRLIQRSADMFTLSSAPGTGTTLNADFRCTDKTTPLLIE